MQTLKELTLEFQQNADRIADELIDGYRLKHSRDVAALQSPLLRWMDFRLRMIDPRPRKILLSDRLPKQINGAIDRAYQGLHHAILDGDDINHFQGRGVQRNDSSGRNRNDRTDLLWADWGIHHLHLAEKPDEGKDFSDRSDYLLFAMFFQDVALFIDVQPHSTDPKHEHGDPLRFAREDLIRVVARNWPNVMKPFQLRGVVAPETGFGDEGRKILRRKGIEVPLVIDGAAYFAPGRGVTSASTPGIVTDAMNRLRKNLCALAEDVFRPDGQFKAVLPQAAVADSHFSLISNYRGLFVYEKTSDRWWRLPDAKFDETGTYYTELADALSPPWLQSDMQKAADRAQADGAQCDAAEQAAR